MPMLPTIVLMISFMFQDSTHIHAVANNDLSEFAVNKKIPKIIEESVLIALSHYPELKETEIDFVFKKHLKKSVMQAQPKFSTLWRKAENRGYQINISAMFRLTNSTTPIHQLPVNIMIGWIGHELGHVMDYKSRSLFSIVRFGAGYLFSERYVRKAEKLADTYAVNHGLGFYILETKNFILDHTDLSEKYKKKIARLYLSPDDIVEQVRLIEKAKKSKK